MWSKRTRNRLAKGKPRAASKALGYLAHIVGDVANPRHTDQSDREERVHSLYESAVDRRIADYRFRSDGLAEVKPGITVRRVARKAHEKYWRLVNAYDAHGYNTHASTASPTPAETRRQPAGRRHHERAVDLMGYTYDVICNECGERSR